MVNVGSTADPIVTRLVDEDKTPWYKKSNLRLMYLWLFLCCMGVEMTSGFDSQLINTLQFSQSFHRCKPPLLLPLRSFRCSTQPDPFPRDCINLTRQYFRANRKFYPDFGNGRTVTDDDKVKYAIEPGLLGFLNACYQLGSVFAIPLAPWFANRFGRRWSIMLGSGIMIVGALLQGFAQHGKHLSRCEGRRFCHIGANISGVGMYIIARMILGVGILFCIISGSALIGELAHPKERPALTSFFNASYFIGQILASSIALGTTGISTNWAWRLPSLLQICPSLLQVATVL